MGCDTTSGGTRRRTRPAALPPTSWTLLAEAASANAAGKAARDEVVARYYRPIRAYIAAILRDGERADELTQSFFERVVLSGRLLRSADRGKGSFRPFVKQALRNFVTDQVRATEKARGRLVHPSDATRGWDAITDVAHPPSAETEYHNAWVRALLDVALKKVREACVARGHGDHFAVFAGRYLCESGDVPSWRELGRPFGLDEKAARNRAETVARHFRIVLRRMLFVETGSVEAADEEVLTLLGLL